MQSNLYVLPTKKNDLYDRIEQYKILDQQIKALTKQKDELKKEFINTCFTDGDDFIQDGRMLMTYRPQLRVTLDQKKLEANEPTIYKAYQVINEVRTFLMK